MQMRVNQRMDLAKALSSVENQIFSQAWWNIGKKLGIGWEGQRFKSPTGKFSEEFDIGINDLALDESFAILKASCQLCKN